ncbi:MAG: DsrE family protein [Gammaproteobacteria bacterium]|nr:DsrE family protein [Gammaproteobacteria bacterium]
MKKNGLKLILMSIASLLFISGCANMNTAEKEKEKLVIQVSSADMTAMNIALNNAVNVQKSLGIDNVDVEIVAYGPGLKMLTAKHKLNQRVASLAQQDVTFSACGNTLDKMAKKNGGKRPPLTEGVQVVPGGVIRIMELQEQGYSYIRP